MELASYLAGERWSDHPACTHPLLAEAARLFAGSEGPTHLRVAEALLYQALALRLQGKGPEADAVRQQAESIVRGHAGDRSPLATQVRQLLKARVITLP